MLIKKILFLSQAFFFIFLVICCFIKPSVVVSNGGISNFGNYHSTIFLYILAFSLNIIFTVLAASELLMSKYRLYLMSALLFILSLLVLLVLISTFPRHISWTYSDIHDYLGIALFSYQNILSIWLILKYRSKVLLSALVIQAIGSLIGLLSILKVIHFLFIGQSLGASGFAVLFITCFPLVIENKSSSHS